LRIDRVFRGATLSPGIGAVAPLIGAGPNDVARLDWRDLADLSDPPASRGL